MRGRYIATEPALYLESQYSCLQRYPLSPGRQLIMPHTTSTDQTRIAYNIAGNGPVDLLFMHGWAGSGSYFDGVVEQLDGTRFRAITFDLRGHGDSALPSNGYG